MGSERRRELRLDQVRGKAAREARRVRALREFVGALLLREWPGGLISPSAGGAWFRRVSRMTGATEEDVSRVCAQMGAWPWTPEQVLCWRTAERDAVTLRGRGDDEAAEGVLAGAGLRLGVIVEDGILRRAG